MFGCAAIRRAALAPIPEVAPVITTILLSLAWLNLLYQLEA
jgi:hypothetical protein